MLKLSQTEARATLVVHQPNEINELKPREWADGIDKVYVQSNAMGCSFHLTGADHVIIM